MDKEVQSKIATEIYMKGCYFFHGDFDLNKCLWSKNSADRFMIDIAKEHGYTFWKQFIHEKDFFIIDKFLKGERQQISGDFRCLTKNNTYEWMHFVMQLEEGIGNSKYSGFITDLSLGYSTKAVTHFRENNGFHAVLEKLSNEKRTYGILVLGIDDFKTINEIHSYTVGDEIIRMFAERIGMIIDQNASLYQLDGDNFGIICPDVELDDMKACFKAIQSISRNFDLGDALRIAFTVSGGICMYPRDGEDGETLFRNARVAYTEAKKRGKDQFVVFNQEISYQTTYQAKLIDCLRDSVKHNFRDFSMVYQPIVYATNDELFGCEALLRWHHDDFPESIGPTEFVPLLEKSGLIIEVGRWIIDQTLAQRKEWDAYYPDLHIAINVAAQQFRDPSFIPYVMNCLEKYQLDPSAITLELTESGEIKDVENINKVFEFFRSQRIRIALDDFGTGYDSLNCLRLLSSDILKIDRSFLERITYNTSDQKILYNIINLCNSMKIEVCIEGIETKQVQELTKHLGATFLQGYYYSRPITAETFKHDFILKQVKSNSLKDSKDFTLSHQESMVYSEVVPAQAMDMNELLEHAYAGIFQVGMDHEFTFLSCNEGYRRMLGYTAREIEEKFANKALGFVHPDDLIYVNQEIRRQLGIGDTVTIEFRIVRKDGSPIWIIGTGNVVRNAKGNPSIVVVIVDNDRSKKKEIAEHEKFLKYNRILNNIPGGIKCVRYDETFTIDYISPSFLSLLGYDERDISTIFDNKYINMIYKEDVANVIGDIMEQLQTSNVVSMRYRSPCKDGSYIWLETISRLCPADEDGIQRCYSSIINVTDLLSEEEKNNSANFKQRFQVAAERWGDILFEYDINTRYLRYSENVKHLLGREQLQKFDDVLELIHKDDRKHFVETIDEVTTGHQIPEIEIRTKNSEGAYVWCSVIFDEPDFICDKVVMLLGKINIIDEEKKERDELILKSQLDSLTGLLNKGTLESCIRTILNCKGDQKYALFMLDVDDFKFVNDNLGHLYGDCLLHEIGNRLQQFFSVDTILGRAGGDEFIAFMPWDGNIQKLAKLGEKLLQCMERTFTFNDLKHQTNISIGIACYPKDGNEFYDLFRKADSALYRIKLQDKHDYCIY